MKLNSAMSIRVK